MNTANNSWDTTPAQKRAIQHPPGPLMILAGAGTGKTTTLLLRISHLITSRQARPEDILILTFTEKAADELRERLSDLLGKIALRTTISTFHAMCLGLIRDYGKTDSADIIHWDDSDKIHFLIRNIDRMDFLTSRTFRSSPTDAVSRSFVPFIGRVQDELISPEELSDLSAKLNMDSDNIFDEFPLISRDLEPEDIIDQWSDLVKGYQFFQKEKARLNVIDYGDMVLNLWRLLHEEPEILAEIRNTHKYIFIDEYQDNNVSLNRIMKLIAGARARITVVGDEDQCIYSFRGANYYNIQDFRDIYHTDQRYGEVKLVENFRSTESILSLANASIQLNTDREPKALKTPVNRSKNGPLPKWIQIEKKDTGMVIAREINQHIQGQGSYGDCAVLCRSTNHAVLIARELQELNIPVDIHVEQFFRVPIIRDILSWMEIVLEGNHSEAGMTRILYQSAGEEITGEISTCCRENKITLSSLSWKIPERCSEEQKTMIQELKNSIERIREKAGQQTNPEKFVWTILKEIKFSPGLKQLRHSYRYLDRLNLVNLGELITISARYADVYQNATLLDWLYYLHTMKNFQKPEAIQPASLETGPAVRIMTIHKSKGLQFPIVFIPFLRSQSFPVNFRYAGQVDRLPISLIHWAEEADRDPRDDHLQEERRIFYVACTRAMNELILLGPEKATSMFLKELHALEHPVMEVTPMSESISGNTKTEDQVFRQKLIADLNRNIASNDYAEAEEILDRLKKLDLSISEGTASVTDDSTIPDHTVNLSASKIEVYKQCGLRYRLKYVDNVPEGKSQPLMEFGSVIHKVLEEFYGLDVQQRSVKTLHALLEKHWRAGIFESRIRETEFMTRGKEMLADFFQYITDNPSDVIGREKQFFFRIPEFNVKISGKIDRIDRDNEGNLSVIDYKTGGSKSQTARKSLQLALYIEAIGRDAVEGVSGSPGNAALFWLRRKEEPVDSHVFSREELAAHMKQISSVADGIRDGIFEPRPNEFNCRKCDYKDFLCQAWEES